MTTETQHHTHVLHIFVDAEELSIKHNSLTVRQILELAGLDPGTHYLIQVQGHHQHPHHDLNEVLHLHNEEKFISVYSGPTTVS